MPIVKRELHWLEKEGKYGEGETTHRVVRLYGPSLKPDREDVWCCADLRKRNCAVKWEKYVLPTIEEIMPRLSGSKVFVSLDATSGFWEVCHSFHLG